MTYYAVLVGVPVVNPNGWSNPPPTGDNTPKVATAALPMIKATGAYLRSIGAQVTVLTSSATVNQGAEVTRQQVSDAISGTEARAGDTLVIAFAWHGHAASTTLPNEGLGMSGGGIFTDQDLADALAATSPQARRIVVCNCCYAVGIDYPGPGGHDSILARVRAQMDPLGPGPGGHGWPQAVLGALDQIENDRVVVRNAIGAHAQAAFEAFNAAAHHDAPAQSMLCIAGANLVSDAGEDLLRQLLLSRAAGGGTYADLRQDFKDNQTDTATFVLTPSNITTDNDVVLAALSSGAQ